MSIYLSKKNLKSLAASLNAKKICNNIYYYENIVNSSTNLIKELDLVDCVDCREGYICAYQIAYCAGVYGNSGQLHKVIYYDEIRKERFKKFVYVVQ